MTELADVWAAKRAALPERWSGNGLAPMTAFEMAAAVYRDSQWVGPATLASIDAYDRRGLLNLVAVLLDRLEHTHTPYRVTLPIRGTPPPANSRPSQPPEREPRRTASRERRGMPYDFERRKGTR